MQNVLDRKISVAAMKYLAEQCERHGCAYVSVHDLFNFQSIIDQRNRKERERERAPMRSERQARAPMRDAAAAAGEEQTERV